MKYNPYYLAYARSKKCEPGFLLEKESSMCGFICYMNKKWNEFMTNNGTLGENCLSYSKEFGEWLNLNYFNENYGE